MARTMPSSTVKSKTTLAAPRWNQALPGRSPTKTGNAGLALPLKNDATSSRPSISRGVPTRTAASSAVTVASGASSRSNRSNSPSLAAAMKASTTSQSASWSSACGLGHLGPRARGQLARGHGRRLEHRRDRRELEAEAVVEDEGDPLVRREPVEHHLQGDPDGVGERDIVSRIGGAHLGLQVVHGDGRASAQPVQTQPGGHGRQPRRQALDLGVCRRAAAATPAARRPGPRRGHPAPGSRSPPAAVALPRTCPSGPRSPPFPSASPH